MKKIIGHRGAAGLALENSTNAFKAAVKLGIGIEFDIRQSKDRQFVVCHDPKLSRVSTDRRRIRDCTWDELKDVKLKDGSPLLRLQDVLKITGSNEVIVELKDVTDAAGLLAVLEKFPKAKVSIASFHIQYLLAVKKLRPDIPCHLLTFWWPAGVLAMAHKHDLQGIALPWNLLRPKTFRQAKRDKLDIYVYRVKTAEVALRLQTDYPGVGICTDYPDRMV